MLKMTKKLSDALDKNHKIEKTATIRVLDNYFLNWKHIFEY